MNINYFESIECFFEKEKNKNKEFLLLIASKTDFNINEFKKNDLVISGGIFPHVIYKNRLFEEGLIAIEIVEPMKLHFIEDIQNYDFDEKMFESSKSIITILEGFCCFNEKFLTKLFDTVEVNTNILGGAAGVIQEGNKPVLFTNNGFVSKSAILLTLNNCMNVSAKHGLDYLEGPFIVTSSKANELESIDYEDAFEVYKRVIKKDCNIELNEENFLEISEKYPIGIVKYKGEEVVRDPMAIKDGKLVLVGEVSQNSMINILKADKENLIKAAKEATLETLKTQCLDILMFNCIGRKAFLDESFQDELNIVYESSNKSKIAGVTTVGEIANSGNRYINFLNKTCVIGGVCN